MIRATMLKQHEIPNMNRYWVPRGERTSNTIRILDNPVPVNMIPVMKVAWLP